ncbi:MAG: methylated-DNA--[protein]-cysteine S-methyltransferase [Sphingomonas sp.]
MYAPDHGEIATPIGIVTVTIAVGMVESVTIGQRAASGRGTSRLVQEALEQIDAWFHGQRADFALPLAPARSARGQALRTALMAIPYGQTMSYGQLAQITGSGARAIGQLCARNPFPLVVPCHRVTAAGGKLGAYSAADGPASKAWLIAHEARHARQFTLSA